MHSKVISFVYLLSSCVYCEILTFTISTPPITNVIECQDATTECIINCNDASICSNKELHCHATSQLPCTINLNANNSAQSATIYTHLSPTVYLNGNGESCAHSTKVYAYERGGTQLFVESEHSGAFSNGYIYGPVGYGSILYMKGAISFQNMKIYDDWTTTVRLEPTAQGSFKDARFYNIFDSSGLNITRTDANYNNVDMNYRAPVYMLDCTDQMNAFARFIYYGTNHGDWFIRGYGEYNWLWSSIYATTDDRVDESIPYNVKLYASGINNFRQLSLYVGVGAEVVFDIIGSTSLYKSRVYAKTANTLTIYCHDSTECGQDLDIECPDNSSPNSCNFICTDSANCQLPNTNIETANTDAYVCNSLYLSSRIFAKIYCGYNQTVDYCNYTSTSDTNTTYSCSSACGAPCTFDNIIAPNSIADEVDALCNDDPITFPTTTTTTTTTTTVIDVESAEGKVKDETTNEPDDDEEEDDDDDDKFANVIGSFQNIVIVVLFVFIVLCCVCVYVRKRYVCEILDKNENNSVNNADEAADNDNGDISEGEDTVTAAVTVSHGNINPIEPCDAIIQPTPDGNAPQTEMLCSPSSALYVLCTPSSPIETAGFIGDEAAPPESKWRLGQCTDCSQYKMGKAWEDGAFYCRECLALY